jgi:hypothetical protein
MSVHSSQEDVQVSHRLGFYRFIPVLVIAGLVAAVMSAPLLGQSVAAQGNSQSAKLCQKGGWRLLQTGGGATFTNQDECVRYGAQDGQLQAIRHGNLQLVLDEAPCVYALIGTGFIPNQEYRLAWSWGGSELESDMLTADESGKLPTTYWDPMHEGQTFQAWVYLPSLSLPVAESNLVTCSPSS